MKQSGENSSSFDSSLSITPLWSSTIPVVEATLCASRQRHSPKRRSQNCDLSLLSLPTSHQCFCFLLQRVSMALWIAVVLSVVAGLVVQSASVSSGKFKCTVKTINSSQTTVLFFVSVVRWQRAFLCGFESLVGGRCIVANSTPGSVLRHSSWSQGARVRGRQKDTSRLLNVKRCVATGNRTRVSGTSFLRHNRQATAARHHHQVHSAYSAPQRLERVSGLLLRSGCLTLVLVEDRGNADASFSEETSV